MSGMPLLFVVRFSTTPSLGIRIKLIYLSTGDMKAEIWKSGAIKSFDDTIMRNARF